MKISVIDNYIVAIALADGEPETEEYRELINVIANKPTAPDGSEYFLRADTLEWELVELPPEPEYEPTTEDKAEAYDILVGEVAE